MEELALWLVTAFCVVAAVFSAAWYLDDWINRKN